MGEVLGWEAKNDMSVEKCSTKKRKVNRVKEKRYVALHVCDRRRRGV